jgi:uncharacterized protein
MAKINKWIRVIHRDLGYFFFGMCIIYGLSGIALNHVSEWNPSYIIRTKEYSLNDLSVSGNLDENKIKSLVGLYSVEKIKKYYWPNAQNIKIFLTEGTAAIDLQKKTIFFESISKRPVFMQINFLHYNRPKKLWTWFSDAFAAGLIIIAITGLFVVKGKNGITWRGAWLGGLGILIPLLLLFFYL